VGLGASDAVGIGALPLTEGYVYEIERRFEALPADVDLHNLGISGARIEDIVAQERDPAIAADPDVVTLWTGANDLVGGADPEVFAAALDALLAALVSETRATVYVGDLPDLTQAPLFVLFPDPDVTTARVAAFNDRIATVVAARGCVLVRLSAFPVVDDLFFFDGFHPNNAGHEQLAAAYWAEIAPRLPE
jgi:lysophospholipase L1-like esterase